VFPCGLFFPFGTLHGACNLMAYKFFCLCVAAWTAVIAPSGKHGACNLMAYKFFFCVWLHGRQSLFQAENEASRSIAVTFFIKKKSQPHALLYLPEKRISLLRPRIQLLSTSRFGGRSSGAYDLADYRPDGQRRGAEQPLPARPRRLPGC
jgi:hypothetical protein